MYTLTRLELGDDTSDERDCTKADDTPPDEDVGRLAVHQAAAIEKQRQLDQPKTAPKQEGTREEDMLEIADVSVKCIVHWRLSSTDGADAVHSICDLDVCYVHGEETSPSQEDDAVLEQPEAALGDTNSEPDGDKECAEEDHTPSQGLYRKE